KLPVLEASRLRSNHCPHLRRRGESTASNTARAPPRKPSRASSFYGWWPVAAAVCSSSTGCGEVSFSGLRVPGFSWDSKPHWKQVARFACSLLCNLMEQSPALEDCLKLLRGERDEQRLAGLLLATKLFQGDDNASVLKVYEAVGTRFLDRLLMTGMGKGSSQAKGGEERAAYLRLSVTVVAAFCRVPEIASSEDMISKVPLVLEIISKSHFFILRSSNIPIIEECFEILLLVATTSEEGFTILYESGSMEVLASNISALPDGSRSMELAMKVLQLILTKFPSDLLINRHQSEISKLVPAIARQFALLHNALKFDALHLLATIMSSKDIVCECILHVVLRIA
ncbi:hypothetical protein Taro_051894, partial [Colocasia esculenta]|nr:hypothetical protein [Colocasia esculenta]